MGDHADDITVREVRIAGPFGTISMYHLDVGSARPGGTGPGYHVTTEHVGGVELLNAGQYAALAAACDAHDIAGVRAVLGQHVPNFLARLDAQVTAARPGIGDAVEVFWQSDPAAGASRWVQGLGFTR